MIHCSGNALKNKKGKGSYLRKGKHGNRGNWEASGKKVSDFFYHWPSAY